MNRGEAVAGGEESGGYAFAFHLPERDGVLSALLLVESLAKTGRNLGQSLDDLAAEFGRFEYGRRDVYLPVDLVRRYVAEVRDAPPASVAGEPVTAVQDRDGVKYVFGERGWLLHRLSGTEPMVRLYCEHADGSKMSGSWTRRSGACGRSRGTAGLSSVPLVHRAGPWSAARRRGRGGSVRTTPSPSKRIFGGLATSGCMTSSRNSIVEHRGDELAASRPRGRAKRSRAETAPRPRAASTGPPTEKTTLPLPWTCRMSTRRLRRKSWIASSRKREAVVEREQAAALDVERLPRQVAAVRAPPRVVDEERAEARRPQDPLERGAPRNAGSGANLILPLYQATQPLRTNTVPREATSSAALGADLEERPRLGGVRPRRSAARRLRDLGKGRLEPGSSRPAARRCVAAFSVGAVSESAGDTGRGVARRPGAARPRSPSTRRRAPATRRCSRARPSLPRIW